MDIQVIYKNLEKDNVCKVMIDHIIENNQVLKVMKVKENNGKKDLVDPKEVIWDDGMDKV